MKTTSSGARRSNLSQFQDGPRLRHMVSAFQADELRGGLFPGLRYALARGIKFRAYSPEKIASLKRQYISALLPPKTVPGL